MAATPLLEAEPLKNKVLPGENRPKILIIKSLKHSVPLKAGSWQHVLIDDKGRVDKTSMVEECSAQTDWRDLVMEAGGSGEEGCEPTKLIEKTLGRTSTPGFSEICHQGNKTITRTSWLQAKSPENQPLTAYEVVTALQISGSKKNEIERSLHTWVGLCPNQQGKLLGE